VVVVPAGTVNRNAEVPCSVTEGVPGVVVAEVVVARLPIATLLMLAVGPKPVTVAVTTVPIGPEVGESVTTGVLSAYVVVAVLPQRSVRVNADPEVIAGRLITPEICGSVVEVPILLLLAAYVLDVYE